MVSLRHRTTDIIPSHNPLVLSNAAQCELAKPAMYNADTEKTNSANHRLPPLSTFGRLCSIATEPAGFIGFTSNYRPSTAPGHDAPSSDSSTTSTPLHHTRTNMNTVRNTRHPSASRTFNIASRFNLNYGSKATVGNIQQNATTTNQTGMRDMGNISDIPFAGSTFNGMRQSQQSNQPLEVIVLQTVQSDQAHGQIQQESKLDETDPPHIVLNEETGIARAAAVEENCWRTIKSEDGPSGTGRSQFSTIYFNDGKRRIDFILVFVSGHAKQSNKSRAGRVIEKEKQRLYFEENLRKEGLELEEDVHVHDGPHPEVTTFVKVHVPWNVLCRQAEILKLKQPTRLTDPHSDACLTDGPDPPGVCSDQSFIRHDEDPCENANGITWPFSRKYIEIFAIKDESTFFWPSRRHEVVWELLQTAHNDPDDEKRRGIESLLERAVYESAFPLHDGPHETRPDQNRKEPLCERQILKRTWASWGRLFKEQPLPLIRKYYGEKVGFYFAFLGFYTKLLIFPSIVGVVTFLYGVFYAGDDVILEDICNADIEPGNFTMCPLCQPPNCPFTKLSEACVNARWDYRFDNEATVAMAVLTVVWATVMLKLWKRRQAELAFEWDTYDVKIEDSVIRPEFEERAPAKRRNPVSNEIEPYVPKSTRILWATASTGVTLLMLSAVGAALAVLVIARVRLYRVFHRLGFHDNVELARWAVHGLIFVVVLVFEKTYSILAHKLTSFECPRTQQEWLSSFLWKVFIFALLNDFVPIGYAAWVKGRLTNTPLDLSWHTELCDTGGCMSEVTELISILLLCRLVIGNLSEIAFPFVKNSWTRFHEKFKFKSLFSRLFNGVFVKRNESKKQRILQRHDAQWHHDFVLGELEEDAVSPEYLEMIVQFAFITLFIPSMPLAPLVCFMNNVIEIRVDAIKFITAHRRPLPIRVPGSQIWNDFLNVIGKLAIICNAGLISFTSNVLPRIYYKYSKKSGDNYAGFVKTSLSQLHHSHFTGDEERERAFFDNNVTVCYYEDYRKPDYPFDRTEMWWQIQCIRLIACAVFLVLSFTFQWFFNFIVSDVPAHVNLRIQRRRYVVTKAMETIAGADAFRQRRAGRRSDRADSVPGEYAAEREQRNGRRPETAIGGTSRAMARRRKGKPDEEPPVIVVGDNHQQG